MFVFYHLDDLILLNRLQVLERISALGVMILVPALREADYSPIYWKKIRDIAAKGVIIVKEQDVPIQFIQENEPANRLAGKSLLMLIHFCLSEHAVMVANEDDRFVRQLCGVFSVPLYTLEEFNIATINNREYFDFMAELKKEQVFK